MYMRGVQNVSKKNISGLETKHENTSDPSVNYQQLLIVAGGDLEGGIDGEMRDGAEAVSDPSLQPQHHPPAQTF